MNVPIASSGRFGPQGPARTVAASAGSAAYRALLPAILLFYATLLPMEVRFNVGDQTIYPPRMVAFLILPWLLTKFTRGDFRYRPVDGFMLFGVTWMIISFMAYYDPATGFMRSIPLAFDVIMPYLTARVCFQNYTDFRRFLVYAAPGIMVAGASMALESFVRTPIIKPIAANIFGRLALYENGVAIGAANFIQQTRLGLLRASGPFSHPIIGGLFLGSFLPLYALSGLKKNIRLIGLVGGACGFFSLSSAAILVMILGLGIVLLDKIQKSFQFFNWRHIIFFSLLGLLLIEVASQNGVMSIIIRYTLDPSTGYYRQLIWEYGSRSVMRNPLIGIGYTDYERLYFMGTSVDHHWLLIAIRHGLPAFIAIFLSSCAALIGLMRRISVESGLDRSMGLGMAATLGSLMFAGLTVTFFGSTLTLFYLLIGSCINMGYARKD